MTNVIIKNDYLNRAFEGYFLKQVYTAIDFKLNHYPFIWLREICCNIYYLAPVGHYTRKTICFLLLVFIFAQSTGLLLFFHLKQSLVHDKVQSALNFGNLQFQQLTLSSESFESCKINDHEIIFEGNLYDIKSIRISGSKIEILAYHDTEEENILERIIELAVYGKDNTTKIPDHFLKLLTLFCAPDLFNSNNFFNTNNPYFFNESFITFNFTTPEIESPPPQLV